MFKDFATVATEWAAHIPFDTVVWLVWGSFGGIFLIALVLTLAVPAVRSASKRPFLCLNYAYTALTFAAFLLVNDLQSSAFVAAVF